MTPLQLRMCRELMIQPWDLQRLINTAARRYKEYRIPKRTPGEMRLIAQPAREVKELQRWLLSRVLYSLPVHPAATAYRPKLNIKAHAALHAPNKFLLKMDFSDFFPSIEYASVEHYLNSQRGGNLVAEDVAAICKICLWAPGRVGRLRLSIGAPTSPHLSNCIMYQFDSEIDVFCKRRGVTYSRYADDLAFSTQAPNVLKGIEEEVRRLCRALRHPRLVVNEAKTRHVSRARRRQLTGLILANTGEVSVGRDRKRSVRAGIHYFLDGKLDTPAKERLRGILSYINSVEPSFLARLDQTYGAGTVARVMNDAASDQAKTA